MSFTEYIQHHPAIALIVGVTHILMAEVLTHSEVPLVVMQMFQLGAWCTTIVVGLITVYGFIKKKKDERTKNS